MHKFRIETKVFLFGVAAVFTLLLLSWASSFFGGFSGKGVRSEEDLQKAVGAKVAENARALKQQLTVNKSANIAAAFLLAPTDPSAGLKIIAPYESWKDADIIGTKATLENALRLKRLANAKAFMAAGQHGLAGEELLAYQSDAKDADVQAIMKKVTALAANERAQAQRAELTSRKQEGVSIGMSRERVIQSSWGRPTQVNTTTNAHGTHEQWVYRGNHSYLYFDNGILTSIQN